MARRQYVLPTRRDLQGLRGIAVLLVVLYHAGVPLLGGGFVGVDLFFVLSGFLISFLLLSEIERTGRIDLAGFWARRARRLLPASTVVLAATALAGLLLLTPAALRDLGGDLRWAALFSANWHFVLQGTDYMAQDRSQSAVLHFWSLGVEEQFYLLWPLLLTVVVLAARHRGRARRPPGAAPVAAVMGGVLVASFVVNVLITPANQPFAFFGSPTRAWQLAAGGLLAVLAPRIAGIGRAARQGAAVVGALLLLVSVAVLREGGGPVGSYPGWGALLPTAGGVLLVAAGTGAEAGSVTGLLGNRVLHWFGDISYSLYLWHWPMLVLLPIAVGSAAPPVIVLALGASVGLSAITLRLVENPFRRARVRRRPLLAVAVGLVGTVGALSLSVTAVSQERTTAPVVVTGLSGEQVALRPNPAAAADDYISLTALGCSAGYAATSVGTCEFGRVDAERVVVLFGDSHAAVLHSALAQAAQRSGWRLVSLAKNGCPAPDVTKYDDQRDRWFTQCDEFRSWALERIADLAPDLVVVTSAWNPHGSVQDRTTGEQLSGAAARAETVAGWVRTVENLQATGAAVAVAHEPPGHGLDTSACLSSERDVRACSFPAPAPTPELDAVDQVSDAHVLDLYAEVCGTGSCLPVVDGMVVYRDSNHMTLTYVRSRVPDMATLLDAR